MWCRGLQLGKPDEVEPQEHCWTPKHRGCAPTCTAVQGQQEAQLRRTRSR